MHFFWISNNSTIPSHGVQRYLNSFQTMFFEQKGGSITVKVKNITKSDTGTIFVNNTSSLEGTFLHESLFTCNTDSFNQVTTVEKMLELASGTFNVKEKITFLENKPTKIPNSTDSIQDAVLFDETRGNPISIWEDYLNATENGNFYQLKSTDYNGKCLTTWKFSTEI